MQARERVQRAAMVMGHKSDTEEHTYRTVDRMLASLIGTVTEEMPFHRKLARLERELGL